MNVMVRSYLIDIQFDSKEEQKQKRRFHGPNINGSTKGL